MGNLTNSFSKKILLLFVLVNLFLISNSFAQPSDLPWTTDEECESIVTEGIVAVTCGVLLNNPPAENFTFGMIDLTGALPAAGRIDVTNSVGMYHHPSWQVDSIGNLFGITMDHCGYTYTTASSQYSSAYFVVDGVIRYGDIGGGAEDISAAGTIYIIDAFTGQASVFAVLPQQAYNFTNIGCEGGITYNRNTGPGLGNIVYSFEHNVLYVTNFEDGRIYRLDTSGNILDSYDPLNYDDGSVGIPSFGDLPYGIDISNDNSQLFFGTIGDDSNNARLYSIDLQTDGSFSGVVDNSSLPAGATWDNYVDSEFEHYEFTGSPFAMSFISDIEFTPSGKLLVGNRVGCQNNLHSSYNHGGRSLLIEADGNGTFNIETVIYVSNGVFAPVNSYGGVSVYTPPTGGLDQFVVSAGDMLSEEGPHGICTQEEGNYGASGNPASPSGIISYLPDDIFTDAKGIGGDVHVFKECLCLAACPTDIEGDDLIVCSGDPFDLSYTLIDGDSETAATWTDSLGNEISPNSVIIDHSDCVPGTYPFYVTAICLEDSSQVFTDTVFITAVTDDISPYITAISDLCSVDVLIDSICSAYLSLLDTIPIINQGDSGTVSIDIIQSMPINCATYSVDLDFDCNCFIDEVIVTQGDCQANGFFTINLDLSVTNSGTSFTIFDQNGNPVGNYDYSELPIQLGPFAGDSTTVYSFSIIDDSDPDCIGAFNFGPRACPTCGICEIPNAFTPDNDGNNDFFTIICAGFADIIEFQIYNRWGKIVHDELAPWDGTHKGVPAPSDVYIYRIQFDTNCEIEELQGDITLVR